MTRTVTRLFNTHTDAMAAVSDLEAAGIPHTDISLVASNADRWHDGHQHPHEGHANDATEGAGKGATTGGLIGGAGGLLAGLGMLAIPGVGPVVAAGWLVSTAVGALAGAAVGGATGGLLGSLKEAGHTDEEAQVYAEGVRRGGTLVSVKASDDRATEAETILSKRAGVDAASRGAAYREMGWKGYSPDAAPYSADEIAAERSRFQTGEARSFGAPSDAPRDISDPAERPIQSPEPKPLGSGF
jgi:hypothetical protein